MEIGREIVLGHTAEISLSKLLNVNPASPPDWLNVRVNSEETGLELETLMERDKFPSGLWR